MCPPLLHWLGGDAGCWLGPGKLICHCLLLELRDGLALVDTGLGTADVAAARARLGGLFVTMVGPQLKAEETALAQVKQLGFDPADVRHLLPTHLDLDHAGGLGDFPDAQVHIYAPEHAAAMARSTRLERDRYRPVHWEHAVRWQLHEPAGERWHGFESVRALPGTQDEVLIVPLVGHSRGHAGIAIKTNNGWLLHAGDAYFHTDEIHATPPRCPPFLALFQTTVQIDREARLANQQRLRELVAAHGDIRVVCAHDVQELRACQSDATQLGSDTSSPLDASV
ncbi:MAG: MBL fold metallo-hydrolase [Polyangiales bacterium]